MNLSTSSRARSLVISCFVPIGNDTETEIRPLSEAGKYSLFTSEPPPTTTRIKNANAIAIVFFLFFTHHASNFPYTLSNHERKLWNGVRIIVWNLPL